MEGGVCLSFITSLSVLEIGIFNYFLLIKKRRIHKWKKPLIKTQTTKCLILDNKTIYLYGNQEYYRS